MTNWEVKEWRDAALLVTVVAGIGLALVWYFAGFQWMVGLAILFFVHSLLSAEASASIRAQGTVQLYQTLSEKIDRQSEEIARLERIIQRQTPRSDDYGSRY